jgi:hypothetical protein
MAGYIITGLTKSFNDLYWRYLFSQTDAGGDLEWQDYGDPGSGPLISVLCVANYHHGYIIRSYAATLWGENAVLIKN